MARSTKARTKPVEEATREELLLFVRLAIQTDVSEDASIDQLRDIVRQCGYDTVEDLSEATESRLREVRDRVESDQLRRAVGEARKVGIRTPGYGAPKVRLRVESRGDGLGDERVSVSVNGFRLDIPVGEPVDVPYPYYEALRNAVSTEWVQREDRHGRPYLEPREVQSYSFSVLEMPSREEVEKWREALDRHAREERTRPAA